MAASVEAYHDEAVRPLLAGEAPSEPHYVASMPMPLAIGEVLGKAFASAEALADNPLFILSEAPTITRQLADLAPSFSLYLSEGTRGELRAKRLPAGSSEPRRIPSAPARARFSATRCGSS